MKKFTKKIFQTLLVLSVGIALGAWFFDTTDSSVETGGAEEELLWSCAMHPHIRSSTPGSCPICGMSLTLRSNKGLASDARQISLSEEAVALAEVSTVRLKRSSLRSELQLEGRLAWNEGSKRRLTTNYTGRIEQLYLVAEGEKVHRGQPVAELYAPSLYSLQTELLQAATAGSTKASWYLAAKQKLQDWGFSEEQIMSLKTKKRASPYIQVLAEESGTLVRRVAEVGDQLSRGGVLYEVADLSRLWVYFEAQETELAWLRVGIQLPFSVEGLPGVLFEAQVEQVSPVLKESTRVVEVQASVENKNLQLRPGMYVRSKSSVSTGEDGLLVPRSAVLWTGKRSLVYLREGRDKKEVTFSLREVQLGPLFGRSYLVQSGLKAGEEVVTEGALSIDASMQLSGKAYMMRPPKPDHRTALKETKQPNRRHSHQAPTPLQSQLAAYFALTEALIASDKVASEAAVKAFHKHLKSSKSDSNYKALNEKLLPLLESMKDASLAKLRNTYAEVSNFWIEALHTWGGSDEELYEVYCPMAQDYKGARWLWKKEEVLNPYFGNSMLRCGRVVKKIEKKN